MRFHYHAHEPVTFPSLGFRMYTEAGVLVTEASTSLHSIYIPSVPLGTGYFDLKIDSLNLLAAKYSISLWATNQHGGLIYDNVENAVTLELHAANHYGANFVIDGRFGIVYFPQKWDLTGMLGRTEDTASTPDLKESFDRPRYF